jgi:hypothetical protein
MRRSIRMALTIARADRRVYGCHRLVSVLRIDSSISEGYLTTKLEGKIPGYIFELDKQLRSRMAILTL